MLDNNKIKSTKTKEEKALSVKIDVVFQLLFGEIGSENITKDLLEIILDRKIEEVDLSKNLILRKDALKGKMGILDVLAKINGQEKVNIEMQVIEKADMIERILFYWSKLYTRDIREGEKYQKLENTIIILFTDYKISEFTELPYHSRWKIKQ